MFFGFGPLSFTKKIASILPSDLSNLVLWLKTSSLSDGAVSSFSDSSGNSNTFSQSTGANQPIKSSSPDIITYNGTTDYLASASSDNILGSGAATIGLRFKINSIPSSGSFVSLVNIQGASNVSFEILLMNNVGGYQSISFGYFVSLQTAMGINVTLDTHYHTIIVTNDGGGISATNYTCYLDGMPQTILTSSAFNEGFTNSAVGARPDGSVPFNGIEGDVVAYSRALSEYEINQLHLYLSQS